jgi:hypothetical protein
MTTATKTTTKMPTLAPSLSPSSLTVYLYIPVAGPDELIADPKSEWSKEAIKDATRKGVACTMDVINHKEHKDLIDNPPNSENESSALHKFAPNE